MARQDKIVRTWEGSNHYCFLTRTKEDTLVVGRYQYRGYSRPSSLVEHLSKLQPPLCWLPYNWNQSDLKQKGLESKREHNPSKLRDRRDRIYEGKEFIVEYYPYLPFSLKTVSPSIPVYSRCFWDLYAAMIGAAKSSIYYMDFQPENVLSANGLKDWRCCDVNSCLQKGTKLPTDLRLSNPPAPEAASFLSKCQEPTLNLFALSIWQLGAMFFKLLSGKALTLIDLDQKEKQEMELDDLCPHIQDDTLSMDLFRLKFGQSTLGQAICLCLDVDPNHRVTNFCKLASA